MNNLSILIVLKQCVSVRTTQQWDVLPSAMTMRIDDAAYASRV